MTTAPGIYLHVPFCASICHYCDFNRVLGDDPELMRRYADAMVREVERVLAARDDWPAFGSVFIGGGTPTLLRDQLCPIVDATRPALGDGAEVTVEANPETVTAELMAQLREAGVNRVSMGAQSFAPHVLEFLGRRHSADKPLEAVEAVRAAGIERVSLDLIYGAPGESDADWEHSLRTAVDAGLDHVSAYALTVEANTPYAAMVKADPRLAPDDDVQARRMDQAARILGEAGLARYEVSNWARPGQESRHNLVYWRGGDWLGIGAGAHGHWRGRRTWQVRAPQRWVELVEAGQEPLGGEETLTPAQRREERLLMGLRIAEGVARADVEPIDEAAAEALVAQGLLHDDGERIAVTERGRSLTGAIILRLLPPD
ncbi:MAG TPA: radical SAM family heme chaperone HemW [Egibacteraceae bacterium]|nr:radical SAM family heme chaperone HemW [Egibacteraceae bacterium]